MKVLTVSQARWRRVFIWRFGVACFALAVLMIPLIIFAVYMTVYEVFVHWMGH